MQVHCGTRRELIRVWVTHDTRRVSLGAPAEQRRVVSPDQLVGRVWSSEFGTRIWSSRNGGEVMGLDHMDRHVHEFSCFLLSR